MKGENTFAGTASHTFDTGGRREAKMALSGTFVGTVVVEYSTDKFVTVETVPMLKTDGTFVVSLTAPATVRLPFLPSDKGGQVRSRVSAYTSGSPKTVFDFDL